MKLGHVLLLPLVVPVALGACSDPPSEPPEAAAYIGVSPGEGACNATHGDTYMPLDTRVYENLNCDLDNGCKPDGVVAVDGDSETIVSCSVLPAGAIYNVSAKFRYKGDDISVTGQVADTGGTAKMTHYSRTTQTGLSGDCTLTMLPNKSAVAGGRVWAHFTCPKFTDPSSPGGMDCAATGAFLFQKCGGG
jgi:hypothetical protein